MTILMFLSFVITIAQGLLTYTVGELLMNHVESVITLITRKPLNKEINEYQVKEILRVIGRYCKIIGALTIIVGIITLIMGLRMPFDSFRLNF